MGQAARGALPAGRPVSPHLMGQNFWLNPPDSAYPIIGSSGVKVMRIGGKAYDDNPLSDAALLKQVDNIRSIGAEPLIQVSRHKGAAVAAATVTFLNVTHGRAVKYWSIGNEPDLNWPGTEADLATYVAGYTKAIAVAMRDVDPAVSLGATEMAFYSTGKYEALLGGAADITGKDPKGRFYVDSIYFHRYPFNSVFTRAAVLAEMHGAFESRVNALVSRIAFANTLQVRTGDEALTWGLTEFNLTFNNPATTINNLAGLGVSSFLNGQFFAEYYRVAMKYGAAVTNTWSLLEGGGNGSSTDFGYIGGSWAAPVMRSSFYHLQMVATYLLPGGYLAATSSAPNLAVVSTTAASREHLAVMLMNQDTTGQQAFTLRMNDDPVSGPGAKVNVPAGLAREFSGSLENQSTVVLVFDAAGNLQQRVFYSLGRNRLNLPPLVETFPVFTRAPATPTQLNATAGNAEVSLRWNGGGAPGYNVKRAPAGSDSFTPVATDVMSPTFTDSGLTNGVAYRYVVTAVNALGESGASAPAESTPELRTSASVGFEAESLPLSASGSTTSVITESAASSGNWVQLNASATGPVMEFTTGVIPAGTYRFELAYKANNNRGQALVTIDGTPIGEAFDQYAPSASFTAAVLGRVTFAVDGVHTVRLTAAGKNAAASGYLLSADRLGFLASDAAPLELSGLNQAPDGTPKAIAVQTTPAGLPVTVRYDGNVTPPTAAGTYAVIARINSADYFATTSGTLTLASGPRDSSRLSNVAVRTTLGASQVLTLGLTMQGGEKPVLVRAAGPALAALGVTDTMADPRLALFRDSVEIAANDNWAGDVTVAGVIAAVGAFPFGSTTSLDAALLARLNGGATLQVSGPVAGNVLVEAYDAGFDDTPRLTNLSALNVVGVGSDVLIAGFTLAGAATKTLLLRAAGPSLIPLGLAGTLADPKLELFTATNPPVKIAENETYAPSLAMVAARVGAFAFLPNSKDAALLINLPAGGYTLQVSGSDGGTGLAIVEVYEVP